MNKQIPKAILFTVLIPMLVKSKNANMDDVKIYKNRMQNLNFQYYLLIVSHLLDKIAYMEYPTHLSESALQFWNM